MYHNGQPSWAPPSPTAILLDIQSRIGGVETGQRMTLEAVTKSVDLHRDTDRRVSHLEAGTEHILERLEQMQAAQPSPQATLTPHQHGPSRPGVISSLTGLVVAMKDLVPLIKALAELALLVLVIVAALKGVIAPEEVRAWLKPSD